VDTRINYNLRLSELLTGDTRGTRIDLKVGYFRDLVNYNMRSVGYTKLVHILLDLEYIGFHHTQLNNRNIRLDLVQFHLSLTLQAQRRCNLPRSMCQEVVQLQLWFELDKVP